MCKKILPPRDIPLREMVLYILAFICLLAAIVVIFIAVFTAPKGEIHSSVLTYFGISLGFVGSLFGVTAHADTQIERIRANLCQADAYKFKQSNNKTS